jgi:hypothetical protein
VGLLAKTKTSGFRTSFFRNQPVHEFYGHLQAVMKEIAPSGEMEHLFAKPFFPNESGKSGQEIEWSTDLSGAPIKFQSLPEAKQKEVANQLTSYIEKIRNYSDSMQGKTGIQKDYADYLKSVSMSPDLNQIFLVNDKPVLVHWGFICENGKHPGQGIYAGWDEFVAEIQQPKQSSPEKVEESPQIKEAQPVAEPLQEKPIEPPSKQQSAIPEVFAQPPENKKIQEEPKKEAKTDKSPAKVPENDLNKEREMIACGLGAYSWIKWLAIILAIIILLLLFLKLLLPKNPLAGMSGMPGLSNSGGMGGGDLSSLESLLGGKGGKGGFPSLGGGKGGLPSSGGGKNNGGGNTAKGLCPHCGHSINEAPATTNESTTEPDAQSSNKESTSAPQSNKETGNQSDTSEGEDADKVETEVESND